METPTWITSPPHFNDKDGNLTTLVEDFIDEDGSPTDDAIKLVSTWHYTRSFHELLDLLGYYFASHGRYSTKKTEDYFGPVIEYHISTGGWSGSEEFIAALKQNHMFWSMCWYQSTRGGHYTFKIKEQA